MIVKKTNKKAFTLTELMATVVIIGLIAAFAIPNFNKSIQRSVERDAALKLNAIKGLAQIYFFKNGNFPPVMNDVSEINAELNTNLSDTDHLTFSCLNRYGNDLECQAVSSFGWSVHIENNFVNFEPHCLSDWLGGDACPTCDGSGC